MDVTRTPLFQLFSRNIRHVMPLFQRQYVWTKERQWEPLWKDISTKANEYMEYRQQRGSEPTQHFLGAVVLNSLRFHGLQVPAELVIDGQQRLTTLQLVLRALSDYAANIKYLGMVQNLEFQLTNRGGIEPFECYKVWPTNADQKVYQDVFQAGSDTNLEKVYPLVWIGRRKKPEKRPQLVEAYLYFYRAIQAYASSDQLPEDATEDIKLKAQTERLDALGQTLMYYLELVKIDLDAKDNPQVIFETLNYRGEPLAPSDLIRNFVFLEARNQHKDDTDLYKRYWEPFDQSDAKGNPSFWKHSESFGRYTYPRMDLFVFHYLVLQTGQSISVGKLYQEFTTWWNKQHPDVEVALKEFQRYSAAYRRLLQPDLSTRQGRFALNLRLMETTTIYPLMLFLFETCKDEIPPADLEGIAIDLESFLVRRAVCNLTTKNYNNLFISILNTLMQERESHPITREMVQAQLLQSQVDTARWPDNAEFQYAWLEYPVYQNMRSRVRVVLEGLDRSLESKYSETVVVDNNKTSIEHLMPQAWQQHYPLPDGDTTVTIPRRNTLIHTIGNLTLLTQALNGSISNGPFGGKRKEIQDKSKLNLNFYFSSVQDKWMEDEIRERGLSIFSEALTIWPHP